MPQPLLGFLRGRALQALPFLRNAVREGIGVTAAIAALRDAGYSGRTQVLSDIYATLAGRADPERIARLQGELLPIEPISHTRNVANQLSNFQYVIVPRFSLGEQNDYLTVSSDVPLSPSTIRILGAELGTEGGSSDIQAGLIAPSDIVIVEANRALRVAV